MDTRSSDAVGTTHVRGDAILNAEGLRVLYENAGLNIVVADVERRIVDCNESMERWLGYSRAELLGRSIGEISHPEDDRHNLALAAESRSARRPAFQMEKRYRRKDGEFVWGLLSVSTEHGASGEPLFLVGMIQDITERKRIEQALRRSEETLRSIFLAAPTGIGMVVNRVITEANDRLCTITGYRREELIGKAARMLYPTQEDFDRVGSEKYRQIAQFGTGTVETHWQRKDGAVIDVLLSSTPLDPGDLDRGVTFTALDITDRKQTLDALKQSEERYRLLFELESDAIFIIDNESGKIREANRAAAELYGYSREELLQRTNRDLSAETEETRRTSEQCLLPDSVVRVPLRRHRKKDGTVFPVEITGRFFEWQGRSVHIAAVRDISERQRADEERRQLEQQMQHVQKLESLGVLAGGIAHDFNNLLMAIMGNADLALQRLPRTDPSTRNLHEIVHASERAADLCRQMLAYSGKGQSEVEKLSLSEIVREMAEMLQVSLSKKASLNYELDRRLPAVEVDASQLRQVVMNLITNASEALGEETGTITVRTSRQDCSSEYFLDSYLGQELPAGTYAWLEVEDTGCGMTRETLEKIFDPFYSTKFAGRGLGLAAALGIVRRHRGAVVVRSRPGAGTTFRVLFPALAEAPPAPVDTVADPEPAPGPALVLLVDDEESVRTVGAEMLRALGFEVLLAVDGQEAVELFRAHRDRIHCVLLDLTMPRMGGEEALRELRRLRSDVPIVLSSGYGPEDAVSALADHPRTGFIQKPYSIRRLRKAMSCCIAAGAER